MKKATTVVMAPAFPSFAKRAKFGVAVPPETKEPMTRPAPPMIVRDDRSVASHYGHDHGDRSENGNTWYSDIADDGQRFNTKIGRGGHADAGKKNKSPLCRSASAEQLLGNRNCKHGKTDTKPSDLRKAGHG